MFPALTTARPVLRLRKRKLRNELEGINAGLLAEQALLLEELATKDRELSCLHQQLALAEASREGPCMLVQAGPGN